MCMSYFAEDVGHWPEPQTASYQRDVGWLLDMCHSMHHMPFLYIWHFKVENWLLMISKKPLTDHCSGTHFGDPLVLPFANTIVGLQGCSSWLIIKSLSHCEWFSWLFVFRRWLQQTQQHIIWQLVNLNDQVLWHLHSTLVQDVLYLVQSPQDTGNLCTAILRDIWLQHIVGLHYLRIIAGWVIFLDLNWTRLWV